MSGSATPAALAAQPPASAQPPAAAPQVLAPPPLAKALGYAGLLPFVAGAALMWFVNADAFVHVSLALLAYAAVIASFLGGMHWGIAVFRPAVAVGPHLAWGVLPSLLAWVAVLMGPSAGLPLLGALLLLCYGVDRKLYPDAGLQAWLGLRFRLSAVAALSCFIGAAGA